MQKTSRRSNNEWSSALRIPIFLFAFCLCIVPRAEPEVDVPLPKNAENDGDDVLQLPTFSILQKKETFLLKVTSTTADEMSESAESTQKLDRKQEFTVRYPPILPNSEQVKDSTGKTLVRGVDYQIDYYPGKVMLKAESLFLSNVQDKSPLKITITYRTLPFAIKPIYKRDLYGETGVAEEPNGINGVPDTPGISTDTEQRTERQIGDTAPQPSSQLAVSGSQTFGISVGSGRSLSQNQELRLNVEGKVSDNITVLARLSDQDLPIQPEGTTENIQDIDQKLIRITHPHVSGTLGDFEGSLGNTEFIFFPRALEGVQVEGDFRWGRFHLIPSSIPKGKSTSIVIPGEEGRGEYRLTADAQYVIVKAGSEIVWLNGERMRRGENNDYVIRDYGDAIIEFNSKHLITSNDVIRVDFEYIPEDRAYQQNLYGINSIFRLPGDRLTVGASYAVEADLNQPAQVLITFDEEDVTALRQNRLDPEGDGVALTAPQKHTIWGLESRLNLTEETWLEGQFAYSAVDKNTYSNVDRKEVSQAWKLIGYSDWDFPIHDGKFRPQIAANLDVRALDAKFVPIGASSNNRTRAGYETQYAKEGFDDTFLFQNATGGYGNTAGRSTINEHDELITNFDLRGIPMSWLEITAGVGRTEEKAQQTLTPRDESEQDTIGETTDTTIRNNFNWGVNFNRRAGRQSRLSAGSLQQGVSSKYTAQNAQVQPSPRVQPTEPTRTRHLLSLLPHIRWNDYRSNSQIQVVSSAQDFRKSRQEGNFSYPLGPFEVMGTLSRLESKDAVQATRNRKRNRSTGRINLVDFKWASFNTSYELERAFAKEPLLTLDGETLGITDWQNHTTARTWKIGIFSQQGKWGNLSTNLARRILKAHTELGSDITTQLADINVHLTPLSRAIDVEVTYELDKKLTTQRREIYTDIHPHTGHRLQPGEGAYVKLDDLHYVEDFEEGTYIKIYQNVGDKPTTAIDAEFRFRFQPRQFFARRARAWVNQASLSTRDAAPLLRTQTVPNASINRVDTTPNQRNSVEWLLTALRGQTRFWLTEEQEAEDAISLYLLRNLQDTHTLFGRVNQHHRLEFSPSPKFSLEFNLRVGRILNRRINTQERRRHHRTWDISLSINPTQRLSVGGTWEQLRETEKYSQLFLTPIGEDLGQTVPPTPISDLRQFEQNTELSLQYELSSSLRWSGLGGYRRTTDREYLDENPAARTRTFSFENRITYRLLGKGRFDINYKLGHGASEGGVPFAQYYFYEGISHEVRIIADYKVRKFTDLLLRTNYRLLSTKQRRPEHRLEMNVSAAL